MIVNSLTVTMRNSVSVLRGVHYESGISIMYYGIHWRHPCISYSPNMIISVIDYLTLRNKLMYGWSSFIASVISPKHEFVRQEPNCLSRNQQAYFTVSCTSSFSFGSISSVLILMVLETTFVSAALNSTVDHVRGVDHIGGIRFTSMIENHTLGDYRFYFSHVPTNVELSVIVKPHWLTRTIIGIMPRINYHVFPSICMNALPITDVCRTLVRLQHYSSVYMLTISVTTCLLEG